MQRTADGYHTQWEQKKSRRVKPLSTPPCPPAKFITPHHEERKTMQH